MAVLLVFAAAGAVVSSVRAADPPRPAPRTYRIVVLPYWSAPGAELASLGGVVARELARDSSRLAQTDRFVMVPATEIDASIARLPAAERDALTTLAAKGDPAAALPLLTGVAKETKADLLVVGTLTKVGGGGGGAAAQIDVESWLLARSPEGSLEDPLRHSFRAPPGRSQAEIARQVAQDDWWSSAEEIAGYVRLGTFHPNEAQKKILELGSNAKRDRLKIIQAVFPEEFIHAQTCDITPTQMRDVTLATQQFVEGFEPKNPRSHNYRGLVEYCGKNEPQALRYFEKAASLDASFPDPWYNAGSIYWKSYQESRSAPDLERAFTAFSKAVEAESGFAEARAKRGLAWLAKGDPQKAEADLIAATREDRDNPDVLMGRCQLAFAAKRPDAAHDYCGRALRADPKLFEAHRILGDIARDRKLTSSAIEQYRAAFAGKPDYPEPRIALTELLFGEKRLREARAEADGMIAAIPGHSVPHYWVGKICEEERDYACAEQAYQYALSLDKNWTTLRDDIARVRAKRGPGASPVPTGPVPPAQSSAPSGAARGRTDTGTSRADATRESYEEFLKKYKQTQKP